VAGECESGRRMGQRGRGAGERGGEGTHASNGSVGRVRRVIEDGREAMMAALQKAGAELGRGRNIEGVVVGRGWVGWIYLRRWGEGVECEGEGGGGPLLTSEFKDTAGWGED